MKGRCKIIEADCPSDKDCMFCAAWVAWLNWKGGVGAVDELERAVRLAKGLPSPELEVTTLRERLEALNQQMGGLQKEKLRLLDRVTELKTAFEEIKGMEDIEQIGWLMRKAKV